MPCPPGRYMGARSCRSPASIRELAVATTLQGLEECEGSGCNADVAPIWLHVGVPRADHCRHTQAFVLLPTCPDSAQGTLHELLAATEVDIAARYVLCTDSTVLNRMCATVHTLHASCAGLCILCCHTLRFCTVCAVHCTSLYCPVLYCVVLCCTVLHCVAGMCWLRWVCRGQRGPSLPCASLLVFRIVLCCAVLYCVSLCCTVLSCVALCCRDVLAALGVLRPERAQRSLRVSANVQALGSTPTPNFQADGHTYAPPAPKPAAAPAPTPTV